MRVLSLFLVLALCLTTESLLAKDGLSKELYLTIYNRDLALVKEIREISIEQGKQVLRLSDIPSGIIPTSFQLRSLTEPNNLVVLEQYYEYEPLEPSNLLKRYLDKEIEIITKNGNLYRGVLASYDNAHVILIGKAGPVHMINRNEISVIGFPELPKELNTKPTLICYVDNRNVGSQKVELSYLTRGMNWNADYVAGISKDERSLSLNGWVTINNNSGIDYDFHSLKLIAGEVKSEEELIYRVDTLKAVAAESIPQFKEEGFFEYHIYTLQRSGTLKNNQTKQLSLLSVNDIPIKKVLVYEGALYRSYYYDNWRNQGYNPNVSVYIDFINKEEYGLGIPLPKGKIRVYMTDRDDMLQFIGEDSISHTPKDEKISLSLGNAFDVVGERKIVEHKKISNNIYQDTYEIILRNHKEEPVEVKVIERQWGDWKVLRSNIEYTKIDANTIEFDVEVPANGEARVTYTSEYRF